MTTSHPVSILARYLNVSERRVQQLAAEGVIPKATQGQYNLGAAMRGYILFLQQRAKEGPSSDTGLFEKARLRLVNARAARAEYDNKILCEQWVEMARVEQFLQELGVAFVAYVDALPGRLAFELTGIEDAAVMKAKLFDACRHLRLLTGERLNEFESVMRKRATPCKDSERPSRADPGPVGGQ